MKAETISGREASLAGILDTHRERLSMLGAVFLGHEPEEQELFALAAAFKIGREYALLRPVIMKGGMFRSTSFEHK